MDWFLFDNSLRHERVNNIFSTSILQDAHDGNLNLAKDKKSKEIIRTASVFIVVNVGNFDWTY